MLAGPAKGSDGPAFLFEQTMTDQEIQSEIRQIVTKRMRLSEIGTKFFEKHNITDPALFRQFWNVARPMLMEVPTLPGCFTEYVVREG